MAKANHSWVVSVFSNQPVKKKKKKMNIFPFVISLNILKKVWEKKYDLISGLH